MSEHITIGRKRTVAEALTAPLPAPPTNDFLAPQPVAFPPVAAPAPLQAVQEMSSGLQEEVQTSQEQRGAEQTQSFHRPLTHHFSRISVSPPLQTKLTVSQPDDPSEVEAEQVAEQVMGMSLPETGQPSAEQESGRERAAAQGGRVARKESGEAAGEAPPIVSEVLGSGGGQPLDGSTRAFMEPRFGHDFSKVRIHTDAKASESARAVNALAYAVGSDIVFRSGQYAPETGQGRKLLAHELTHVVQQMRGLRPQSDALSAQRQADQHAGTALPDAARQRAIAAELNPTSTAPGGVSIPWDGGSASTLSPSRRAAARRNLQRRLTLALENHLRSALRSLQPVVAARRLPMTQFEGAGVAAKRVTDARFGSYASAAALTPGQAGERSAFQFRASGPNQTLFDAFDPAQRAGAGHPVDPGDLATWIAETDGAAQTVQSDHHFNPNRGGEEETFLYTEVLDPFVAAHRAELERYDLYGFAISGDRIVVGSNVEPGLPDQRGSNGEPSPAERAARWGVWKTLVHEYIHKLQHPAFGTAAGRGNRILTEGFCELFTKEVLLAELPGAPGNDALRRDVEGGLFSPPTPQIIGGYDPGSYAEYLQHAEAIRDRIIGGTGGVSAVKAAFFQGHVEFLGLNPNGSAATPAPVSNPNLVTVPSGVATLAELAARTGVPGNEIQGANPGLSASGPLPRQVIVPGCRDHVVVEAAQPRPTGGVAARTAETRAQIATQNGVTEAALNRANPGIDWAALTAGRRILIPRH